MKPIKTLADYIDENSVKVTGGPSYLTSRSERMKAIIIDSRPLGTYELDFKHDKERTKRFIEYQWVAISLVGCDADFDLKELRSLAPRNGMATPDFEATTRTGDIIRIELCRLVDEAERKYFDALAKIGSTTQKRLDKTPANNLKGTYMVRFYGNVKASLADVATASEQLANFIQADQRLPKISSVLHAVGSEFFTLHRLKAHVAHLDADGPAHVLIDGPVNQSDVKNAMTIFLNNFEDKKAKYGDYSEGHAVWLVFVAESGAQRFIAASLVEHLRNVDTFDPTPFERVFLGCFTMGVTFETPNRKPRYSSLTETG